MKADRKIVAAGLLLASAVGGYVLSHIQQSAGAQTAIVNRGDGRGWRVASVDESELPPRIVGFQTDVGGYAYRLWSDGRLEVFDAYYSTQHLVNPNDFTPRFAGWRVLE